ncbi:RpiR family transcriptional regulator [Arthrobacter sp. SW1]|uniref:MurR/RpiR family transcriptional regulator n=1 Tax=Arthrobacter sp. SW1 TaxID=1920889 RepID=UPI000877CDBA|nr:MurR/RpiR family transcriptional regulator [Arthrobacter sp. SW1]OFI37150.1 RpiR family transcriptional regulator [Arthrobacter sp. SW1]
MRIDERIGQHYPDLGPQEQKAADTLLDHLGDLAVYNAAELARLSGVSKATMSRLFRRLGFADFTEVKEHTRQLRASGIPVATHDESDLAVHLAHELEAVRRTFEKLDAGQFTAATEALAAGRQLLLIGYRNSFPLALHLRQQLLQCRGRVAAAPQPGQSIGEELAGCGPGDVVLLMGFRRRPATFGAILQSAAACGATTILIGDPSARRYAAQAGIWLECPVESASAFDSYASAMSLMSALANGVLTRLSKAGRDRIREATAVFGALGELDE